MFCVHRLHLSKVASLCWESIKVDEFNIKRLNVNHVVPAPLQCFSMTTKHRHALQNCKRHCSRLRDRYAAGAEMVDGIFAGINHN